MYSYRAEHYKKDKTPKFLKRLFLPALIPALVVAAVFAPLRLFVIFPVKINTNSMPNTIAKDSLAYFLRPHLFKIEKDDVVLVKNTKSSILILCRVVATQGQKISIQDGFLKAPGGPSIDLRLKEDFAPNLPAGYLPAMQNIDILLGDDEFYCINENRNDIQDSRLWGGFSTTRLEGIFLF